jgi:5'-nucleotidase
MNIGENSGISSFYSGTVAGAREGAFWRIPSFAFSVCAHGRNHLDAYSTMSASLLKQILANEPAVMTGTTFYNVNFPDCAPDKCLGIKATRQSCAYFDDKYKAVTNTDGSEGFIVYGDKMDLEESNDFDSRAIINNYIAITPLCFDATAVRAIPFISKLSQQSE